MASLIGRMLGNTALLMVLPAVWLIIVKFVPPLRRRPAVANGVAASLVCLVALPLIVKLNAQVARPIMAAFAIVLGILWWNFRRDVRALVATDPAAADAGDLRASGDATDVQGVDPTTVVFSSRQVFKWATLDTPYEAVAAAKGAGVAFAFLAFGYLVATLLTLGGFALPGQETAVSQSVMTSINLCIAGVAAFLAWRTLRRPSTVLCSVALGWSLLELVGAAYLGFGFSIVSIRSILGTLAAINGFRGALAMSAFRRHVPA